MVLNKSEAYWNSYKLLESQLIKLSHSISFDDKQINVYSSELADIINSACIKIESVAKDIYEEHIYPFQIDGGIIPKSFANEKRKKIFQNLILLNGREKIGNMIIIAWLK